MLSANYKCEGQISIFDIMQSVNIATAPSVMTSPYDFMNDLVNHGSLLANGKQRIYNFFSESHSLNEKVDFLKSEYGIGGFSGRQDKENYIHSFSTICYEKGKQVECSYVENGIEHDVFLTWKDMCKAIASAIKNGTYYLSWKEILKL